jgi:hypothetical protein
VAIAVKQGLVVGVTAWAPVNQLLMWMIFNSFHIFHNIHNKHFPVTIVQCYAPTDCSEKEAKDSFYDQLVRVHSSVSNIDLLIVMGDFNARVGSDYKTWSKTLGRFGIDDVKDESDNGLSLLDMCSTNDLSPWYIFPAQAYCRIAT